MNDGGGEGSLACGIIELALLDTRDSRRSRRGYRNGAIHFLRGGAGSMLDFWCRLSGLNRIAVQEKLFGGEI